MVEPRFPWLRGRRFRASKNYRLVAHADLGEAERRPFATFALDPDHFGLLVPTSLSQSGVKAVGNGIAGLLSALAEPSLLPSKVLASEPLRVERLICGLVLDGILELHARGEFISGPAASYLFSQHAEPEAEHPLVRLSQCAMTLSLAVPTEEPTRLSSWLYGYNTIPLGPGLGSLLRREESLLEELGLDEWGRNNRALAADFLPVPQKAWHSWQSQASESRGGHIHLPYKLYVSPHPRALLETIDPLVSTLIAASVPAFKLGRGVSGLLRPDKFVVYLDSWERLRALADELARVLSGVTPQGVPFTAPLLDNELLSFGMDPPHATLPQGWGQAESWRLWITNHLARSLLYARATGADRSECLAYASTRLSVEGVATNCWMPSEAIWELDEGTL